MINEFVFSTKLVFISFWVLHICYGLGLIWGLLRFTAKWRDNELKDHHFNKKQFNAKAKASRDKKYEIPKTLFGIESSKSYDDYKLPLSLNVYLNKCLIY